MGNFKTILLCLMGVILGSCREEEPYVYKCEDGAVKFELFNDELNPRARLLEPGSFDMGFEIIQNENELYQKLFIAYLKKKIDFTTKSLIVISVKNNTRASVMSQSVTADCAHNRLTITADLRYWSTPVGGIDHVFAIVPKIPYNTAIKFIPKYSR
ncbi:MAG: hypothetical protein J7619_00995 [Dyadobacter sp.]|nr:hypothetical protein [Dyadobacter sp.]